MKSYDCDKTYKVRWLVSKSYLDSSDALWGGYQQKIFDLVEKYPISKIKYDKENYPNPINIAVVSRMHRNFYPYAFTPIIINSKSELIDGQHRLELASWFGWEFIDVLVMKEDFEQEYYMKETLIHETNF